MVETPYQQSPEDQENWRQSLPIPPTVEEILLTHPEQSPISEADFERVATFFRLQQKYFQELAEKETDPERQTILLNWANRLPTLAEVIRENTRLITESAFSEALPIIKQKVEEFVGEDPYIVFLHGDNLAEAQHHSTLYVAQQMGLPENCYVSASELLEPGIQDFINNGGKVVIVDDASYSSQNISDHLMDIESACPNFHKEQLFVGVVAATNEAMELVSEEGVRLETVYRVPQLEEVLESEDYRILRFLHRPDSEGKSVQILCNWREVLTLFWQKVPDNFCHPLRKWDNKYWDGRRHHYWKGYLVDDSPKGIHPNYRAGKTFIYS